ncbi:MAG: peptidoglycan-binding domain-containing protein [Gaiellales bacterium]
MRTRSLILVLIVALGLGAAACGGGDEAETDAADTGVLADTGLTDTGAVETPVTEPQPPEAFQIKVPAAGEVIGPQSPSAQIEQLQKALKLLGFKVTTDGQYGPRTVKAVKKFQKQHKLERDGLVGAKTARAINKELRQQAAEAG